MADLADPAVLKILEEPVAWPRTIAISVILHPVEVSSSPLSANTGSTHPDDKTGDVDLVPVVVYSIVICGSRKFSQVCHRPGCIQLLPGGRGVYKIYHWKLPFPGKSRVGPHPRFSILIHT